MVGIIILRGIFFVYRRISECFLNFSKASHSKSALFILLSEEETNEILKAATECAEGECSIDDVTSLITDLEDQKILLQKRLDRTMNLVAQLQHLNEKEEREVSEVRSFLKDLTYVFTHDEKKHFATGYSGEINDGPKTAWDVLSWGKKAP